MIDLRSDTVTVPTDGMRRAIATAAVGDDIYGEDPTVRRLEERVAELFGAGGAVFTPTVTMANLVALSLLAAPGDEIICDVDAHIVRYESGAAAVCGGIQTRTTCDPAGTIPVASLERLVRAGAATASSSGVRTRAVAVEQTHNQRGGRIYPLAELQALRSFTRARAIAVHCDGARLWHAHVATGVPLSTYAAQFDTVAVCLSKGLGCPAGALLVLPNTDAVTEARRLRRRYGGSMRQTGLLAAAGLHALDHHIARLADDHRRARTLADAVNAARPGTITDPVETNIAYLELPEGALTPFLSACRVEDVALTGVHGRRARFITHLGVDDAKIARAIDVLTGQVSKLPAA